MAVILLQKERKGKR